MMTAMLTDETHLVYNIYKFRRSIFAVLLEENHFGGVD